MALKRVDTMSSEEQKEHVRGLAQDIICAAEKIEAQQHTIMCAQADIIFSALTNTHLHQVLNDQKTGKRMVPRRIAVQ